MEDREKYIKFYLNDLISQYQRKPNIEKIFKAFLSLFYDVYSQNQMVSSQSMLENATGDNLDRNGEIVGLKRPFLTTGKADDNLYKLLLLAKIGTNNSQGSFADILSVASKMLRASPTEDDFNQENFIEIYDHHFGSISIAFRSKNNLDQNLIPIIKEQIQKTLATGKRLAAIIELPPENEVFRFGGSNFNGQWGKFAAEI